MNADDVLGDFSSVSTDPRNAQLRDGFLNASSAVDPSPDFTRVFQLPRKTEHDWEVLAEELTLQLKTEHGDWKFKPIQAEVLMSIAENLGTFASIGVGGGKTLMSFAAGTVADCFNVVVIVPAKLRKKTKRDFKMLSEKFFCASELHVLSADELGLKDGLARLTEHGEPDMIVIDECHKFKNPSAARTRKLMRYLRKRREADRPCKLLAMSGTVTNHSIKDFAHLLREALGDFDTPLPNDKKQLAKWARLVDPNVDSRCRPGPFQSKLPEGYDFRDATPETYREIVHERIFTTPGVVKLPSTAYGGPIELSFIRPKSLAQSQEIQRLLHQLIEGVMLSPGDPKPTRIQPNGDECFPGDVYRHTRCLCLGFWYDWEPEPPEHWKRARRGWRSYCRQVLEAEIEGLDSELMVVNAIDRGWYLRVGGNPENPEDRLEIDDSGLLNRWRAVKPDYKGRQVARWVTHDILHEILREADVKNSPQLIWTEYGAVGDYLETLGFTYYRNQGLSKDKRYIGDAKGDTSPVLSVRACGEGLNLQDRWHRALYLTPMPSGQDWEQTLGRIHRPGQEADSCEVQIVTGHDRLEEAFDKAMEAARYMSTMQGAPQKLTLADIAR